MRLGRHIPAAAFLSLLLLSARTGATSYSAYKFEMLQGLAQSSDTVLTATVESVAVGVRGDRYRDTTDTLVVCLVTAVHLGPKHLKGKRINVLFGAGDEPIREPSPEPVLLLLKREGDDYRLSFYNRYGVFRLQDGIVQVAFEPKKKGLYWSYYTHGEIVSRIKDYAKARVEITLEVADGVSLSDRYLPVTFRFRNTGRRSVLLLPPSFCFNSLLAERVVPAGDDPGQYGWEGVDHWGFMTGPEPPSKLAVGAERSYTYRVPFDRLNVNAAGEYRVKLNYYPHQLSKWGEEARLTDRQKREAWLGVTKRFVVIHVKGAAADTARRTASEQF